MVKIQANAYPPEVTTLLFELGPRKLIWVEGLDDEETFREWFLERLGEVQFYAAGGWKSVAHRVLEYRAYMQHVYGIMDRDFRSEEDIAAALADPEAHLFILHRYAIENYLLEPAALAEQLRLYYGAAHPAPAPAAIETEMLALCQALSPIMAANWLFYEIGLADAERYFQPAHELPQERAAWIAQVARRAGRPVAETEPLLAEKEAQLEAWLNTLAEAHTCINGKHLLHHVYRNYISAVRHGLPKDYFRRLLANTVKRGGLPADIVTIVEQRILQRR